MFPSSKAEVLNLSMDTLLEVLEYEIKKYTEDPELQDRPSEYKSINKIEAGTSTSELVDSSLEKYDKSIVEHFLGTHPAVMNFPGLRAEGTPTLIRKLMLLDARFTSTSILGTEAPAVSILDTRGGGVFPVPSTFSVFQDSAESGVGTFQEPSSNTESSQNYPENKVPEEEKFPDYSENVEKLEAGVVKIFCTFLEARSYAISKKKWLLVNILNVNDKTSQLLNRDVWSKPHMWNKMNDYFIFWQVDMDSAEGKKYCEEYNPVKWPYVSVIDPRNGKCICVWNRIKASSFRDRLTVFLQFNSYEEKPESKEESLIEDQMELLTLDALCELVKQLQERIERLEATSDLLIKILKRFDALSGDA